MCLFLVKAVDFSSDLFDLYVSLWDFVCIVGFDDFFLSLKLEIWIKLVGCCGMALVSGLILFNLIFLGVLGSFYCVLEDRSLCFPVLGGIDTRSMDFWI